MQTFYEFGVGAETTMALNLYSPRLQGSGNGRGNEPLSKRCYTWPQTDTDVCFVATGAIPDGSATESELKSHEVSGSDGVFGDRGTVGQVQAEETSGIVDRSVQGFTSAEGMMKTMPDPPSVISPLVSSGTSVPLPDNILPEPATAVRRLFDLKSLFVWGGKAVDTGPKEDLFSPADFEASLARSHHRWLKGKPTCSMNRWQGHCEREFFFFFFARNNFPD